MWDNNFDPEERIDWELQKEQQEQKKLGWNAFKKPRKGGCRLPHERLTKKQLMDLNGEVKVMNMNAPVSFKAFKMWPVDIQEQYLNGLVEKYKVNMKQVAEMFGVVTPTLSKHIKNSPYQSPFSGNGKHSDFKQAKWDAFCQNTPESLQNGAGETNDISEGSESVFENASESLQNGAGETEEEKYNRVIDMLQAGMITLNDAYEMLGMGFDCEKMNQERIEDMKQKIETLEDELKNTKPNPVLEKGCFPDYPYPWEFKEKPAETKLHSDLQFLTFSFRVKDLKSWDELFEFVKAVKLPFHNTVEISVQKYWNAFGPGEPKPEGVK